MIDNYFKRYVIIPLICYCLFIHHHTVSAHEGHDHSHEAIITIGKKTFVHLQSVLSAYLDVYHQLVVKKEMDGISDLAQKLSDAAWQGIRTEPVGPGRHMMQHIQEGAEWLSKANNTDEAQGAFLSITHALIPFFKTWPNQLQRNELKMYRCEGGHSWLQQKNTSPVCPCASNGSPVCLDVEEVNVRSQ
ncbi:MAG: hypothetical protein NG747_12955 [Candidatus Brocadia sp.]|nr:hypothetical protein [Candidatus Brocadia sp.]